MKESSFFPICPYSFVGPNSIWPVAGTFSVQLIFAVAGVIAKETTLIIAIVGEEVDEVLVQPVKVENVITLENEEKNKIRIGYNAFFIMIINLVYTL